MAMYCHPDAIVSGAWLQERLDDPALRIYDCTFYLDYGEGTGRPYSVRSGRADYERGHIPGSAHLDLQHDFSEPDAPTAFMHMSPAQTATAFARHGLVKDARVVLYSRGSPNRATRFWWLLRWIGFDSVAILDGGFDLWEAEGRPRQSGSSIYPAGSLVAQERSGLWADKAEMLAAIADGGTCSINALDAALHLGQNPRYGRPGRIPGSASVPAAAFVDPGTQKLIDPEQAAALFEAAGASKDKRILNYCGGGIAATLDAFLQWQLGFQDIAVYDASMSEWATDAALPMEIG